MQWTKQPTEAELIQLQSSAIARLKSGARLSYTFETTRPYDHTIVREFYSKNHTLYHYTI